MDNKLNQSMREWLKSKLFYNGVAATFTHKQNLLFLDNTVVERNFRYFKNVLNKKIFGNAYKRFGKQLKMLVVREETIGRGLHLHTIIEKPTNILLQRFIDLIRYCWNKTLFSHTEVDIQQPPTKIKVEGWFRYIMKNKSKIDLCDSIDLENSSCLQY